LQKFSHKLQLLSTIIIVDKFPTVAEYIEPTESEFLVENLLFMDQKWCDVHLRTSQYLTQIAKCMDNMCYLKARSSYFSVVTGRFLPPPLPITQASVGLKIPERTIDGMSHNFYLYL